LRIDSFRYDFYHLYKNDVNMDEKPVRETDGVKKYHIINQSEK